MEALRILTRKASVGFTVQTYMINMISFNSFSPLCNTFVPPVELRRMMQNVASVPQARVKAALTPIQDIVTLVNFANDECDYGMGLELGLDLFLFGNERLHPTALFLLQTAYTLLQRTKFVEIIKDHIACRKTEDLDYLNKKEETADDGS